MKLKWAFKMYDIDKNGFITQDEMNHILQVGAILKEINVRYATIKYYIS
jgi:Ca2+-binding EF-hand superfamily protein